MRRKTPAAVKSATQDNAGNVWYLGEDVTNYEFDDEGTLIATNSDGAWETGVDGALPGYIMPANPQVGDKFFNEFYPGEAEDHVEVLGIHESHSVTYGDFTNVVHTRDFTLSFESYGENFLAPGVGSIMEHDFDISGTLLGVTQLRSITVVPEPNSAVIGCVGLASVAMLRRRPS